MRTAEIVLGYIRAVQWPVVVLTIALVFRKSIRTNLQRLSELSGPGVSAKFEHQANEVAAQAVEAFYDQYPATSPGPLPGYAGYNSPAPWEPAVGPDEDATRRAVEEREQMIRDSIFEQERQAADDSRGTAEPSPGRPLGNPPRDDASGQLPPPGWAEDTGYGQVGDTMETIPERSRIRPPDQPNPAEPIRYGPSLEAVNDRFRSLRPIAIYGAEQIVRLTWRELSQIIGEIAAAQGLPPNAPVVQVMDLVRTFGLNGKYIEIARNLERLYLDLEEHSRPWVISSTASGSYISAARVLADALVVGTRPAAPTASKIDQAG